jgi:hypothetical protein
VPDSFRTAVAHSRAATRAQGLAVEAATRHVTRLLEADGIRVLPLKGPLLAADLHGDTGLRATHDVDVLVGRDKFDRALAVLRGAGFRGGDDPVRADGLPDLHFTLRHSDLPPVELHWRVHWDERAFSEGMLERAEPAGDGLLRARPDDLAAALLLFYARDGLHGMRIPADIAAWADRNADRTPPRWTATATRWRPTWPSRPACSPRAGPVGASCAASCCLHTPAPRRTRRMP